MNLRSRTLVFPKEQPVFRAKTQSSNKALLELIPLLFPAALLIP